MSKTGRYQLQPLKVNQKKTSSLILFVVKTDCNQRAGRKHDFFVSLFFCEDDTFNHGFIACVSKLFFIMKTIF